jgi:hypothetical protein
VEGSGEEIRAAIISINEININARPELALRNTK